MLQEITIKNFKSIADDTIELGRVNVFIGENGCGKSNILEAVGFASALENGKVELESLRNKGIRTAKPSLMLSSFSSKKQVKNIIMDLFFSNNERLETTFFAETLDDIHTNWIEKNILEKSNKLTKFANSKLQGITLIDEPELLLNRKNNKNKELKEFINILNEFNIITENEKYLHQFLIYTLNTPSLRGLVPKQTSNNIYGEGLDILIANFDKNEQKELKEYNYLISWLDDYLIDANDILKFKGFKQNLSQSKLYFADKLMSKKNNIFSSENANEGILHVLFYLAVMISKRTPKFFAIDNIESSLNPHLCRHLMTEICKLAKKHEKQLLITTHNPAILDGLNLFDDEIRLFVVSRNQAGHTKTRRVKLKPDAKNEATGENFKLSELWTRGYLGAISENF